MGMMPLSRAAYHRHGRYWLPKGHRPAARYFVQNLLAPRSRRMLVQSSVAHFLPTLDWPSVLASASGEISALPWGLEGVDLGALGEFFGDVLFGRGLATKDPPVLLMLEDYPGSKRRQTVIFLFGRDSSSPIAVAKLSREAGPREALEATFGAISTLHAGLDERLAATIPEPLALGDVGDFKVLVESVKIGRTIDVDLRQRWQPRRVASGHFGRARDWLVEFHRATRIGETTVDAADSSIGSVIETFARKFEPTPAERRLISRLDAMRDTLRGERLPLVARQGDYWARNIVIMGDGVGVVDWEHFEDRSTPFDDLFMFATSYGLGFPWRLAQPAGPVDAFRALYVEPTWMAALARDYFRSYCAAMDIAPQLLDLFLPVFLMARGMADDDRPDVSRRGWSPTLWRDLLRAYAAAERPEWLV